MEDTIEMEEQESFWINPCGLVEEPDSYVEDPPLDKLLIKEELEHSIIIVKNALSDARKLKEYLKTKYPSINMEHLGEMPLFDFLKFPKAKLEASKSISYIPIAYNCLQRHAVALEQMMEDSKTDDEYFSYLRDKKRSMINVLCSLYELIILLRLLKIRDVTRAVMPKDLRKNATSRLVIRDVIVANKYADFLGLLYNILISCEKIL